MLSKRDDKAERIAEAAGMAAAYHLYARFVENKKMLRAQRTMATSSAAEMPMVGRDSGFVRLGSLSSGQNEVTGHYGFSNAHAGMTANQTEVTKPKIEQAVDILTSDKLLRRLTLRELEDKFPSIGRNTWGDAKQRLKKNQQ
jgi:hypothetical protein